MVHFQIKDLSFSYPGETGKEILHHVNLTIGQGEYVVLCGKSGSGKTTLLRHLKSVLTPHGKRSGEILFEGKPLEQVSHMQQSAQIGYVMQNPDDQIVTDKVWHELSFGLESLGCDQKTMRARVAEMACYFGIGDWFHRDVAELSGGQKQLLNLASIMAMHPKVLILDEPTSQLDPIAASDFLNTVRKINLELGTTVIITEHRLEDVFPHADRTVVMDNGRILADDSPRNIGKHLYEKGHDMFAAMPTPMRVFYGVQGVGECPVTVRDGRNWLSRTLSAEQELRKLPDLPESNQKKQPALEMKELWFRYQKNGPDILRGASVIIHEATLHAIVGGNGAGKSTALKASCGICRPYRGKVRLFGKPLESYKNHDLFGGQVAMLPQDPRSLFVRKTLLEDLQEMTKDSAAIHRVATLCQVADLLDHHPYDLSGGEQQRGALAKVLLTKPKLLLLDEPTKGLDSFFKETFAQILRNLIGQGITIVMVSHDVEFCARYADQVSMFFDGQFLTTDVPRRFFGNNSFYTTAANRMSRHVMHMAVTVEDVIALYGMQGENHETV
ncbi:MAG: ATP-binding cassette domain-containing protein [Oscillospiraceae bacterium]|nr:ATP-binding cassette domain-containing protein [Oscillospiraceae bacterium]